MEVTDIVYLLVLDKLYGITWPVSLKFGYIYDYKSVDISYADWILIYNRGSSMDWFGIGGQNYRVFDRTTIDVRTRSKSRYGQLKKLIKSIFTGNVFSFVGESTPSLTIVQDTDYTSKENLGVYVDRYYLVDPDSFTGQRGDYVKVVDSLGNEEYVWVWGVYGKYLYVLKKSGIYCLIRPRGIDDLSDKMKGMYRFVMDVEGELIESVGGE